MLFSVLYIHFPVTLPLLLFLQRLWAWPSWWGLFQGKHYLPGRRSVIYFRVRCCVCRQTNFEMFAAFTTPSQWCCVWESQLWCVCLSLCSASRARWAEKKMLHHHLSKQQSSSNLMEKLNNFLFFVATDWCNVLPGCAVLSVYGHASLCYYHLHRRPLRICMSPLFSFLFLSGAF